MGQSFFRTALRDDRETEIQVEIAVHAWGCAAQTYGPPESCFPGEPPEVEIVDAWLLADADHADAPSLTLTDAERERIELEFIEDPPEPDYPEDF